MRISDNMNYGQVKNNLSKNRKEMSDMQNQAATMKRVTRPSDDPVAATRVLSARTSRLGIEQYQKDLNSARSFLDASDHALEELTELFMRLKELAIQQANAPSTSEDSQRVVAEEVVQMYKQAVAVANRQIGDRYIFGGYKTTEPAFTPDGVYNGDQGEITIEINKEVYLPMNIPGNKVFLGEKLGTRNFIREEFQTAPRNLEHLKKIQALEGEEIDRELPDELEIEKGENGINVRSPASVGEKISEVEGDNVFDVIRTFAIALKTGDKATVQDSIERVEKVLDHVIQARAQVGSRAMTLDSVMNTLQKSKIDTKVQESAAEDADAFELFSDISKNEATLKATLETSGRLIQPSLLDFLR